MRPRKHDITNIGGCILLCLLLLILLGISLLVVSFSAFQLSPAIKTWLGNIQETTTVSLSELASTSTDEALSTLSVLFGVVAAILFLIFIAFESRLQGSTKDFIVMFSFSMGYAAVSINAWRKRREEILSEFFNKATDEAVRYTKFFLILSLIVVGIGAAISLSAGELAVKEIGSLGLIIPAAGILFIMVFLMSSAAPLFIVLGPALLTIAYVWATIYFAKGALYIGKKRLVNFLVLYAVFGTLYFTALGFPKLRDLLHLPVLCE